MRTMRRRGAGLGLGETTRMGVGCGGGTAKLSRSSGEKRDGGGASVTTSSMGAMRPGIELRNLLLQWGSCRSASSCSGGGGQRVS